MKSCLLLAGILCCGSTVFAQAANTSGSRPQSSTSQAPPPSPSVTPSATPATPLKARGFEAVAAQDPTRVVATIDGKSVTAREAAEMLKAIPPDQLKRYQSNLPNVVQQLYMSQALAQQALKLNMDQQSPLKEQLELSRNGILAQAYMGKLANDATKSGPAPDPAQYYNAHPDEFDRVKLSGIFVAFNPPGTPANNSPNSRTEEQSRAKADDIEKKLKAGGDFTTLARTESENQASAAKGGEIGNFSLSDPQFPPDLKTAVQKLQPGQVSEPVRLPNAFLILKEDSHNKMTMEQARPEIVQKLQKEKNEAAVKQEVDKYKIQVKDPDFFNGGASPIPSLQRPQASAAPPAGATSSQP